MKPLKFYRMVASSHAPHGQKGKLARQWYEKAKAREAARPRKPPQPGRITRLLKNKLMRQRVADACKQHAEASREEAEANNMIAPFNSPFYTCNPAGLRYLKGEHPAPEDDPYYDQCPFMRNHKCYHPGRRRTRPPDIVQVKISRPVSIHYLPGLEPREETTKKLCCIEAAYAIGKEWRQKTRSPLHPIRYEVEPINDEGQKQLDSFFGLQPCYK